MGCQVVKKNFILYLLNEMVLMIDERACCDWVSMMSGNSGGGFQREIGIKKKKKQTSLNMSKVYLFFFSFFSAAAVAR